MSLARKIVPFVWVALLAAGCNIPPVTTEAPVAAPELPKTTRRLVDRAAPMPDVVYLWSATGSLLAKRNPKCKAYPFKDGVYMGNPPRKVQPARWYRYDLDIAQAAWFYGVDPVFLKALLWVESGNAALVVSHAGAIGVAQLMPATAARLGVKNPFDPHEAIWGSSAYLRRISDLFQTQNMLILAASYNAGEHAVEKILARRGHSRNPWAVVPRITETEGHVRKVLGVWDSIHRGIA